jgi:translocator protein
MFKKIKVAELIFSIFICFFAGAVGSIFTFPSIPTWYASLNKPFFNPPNWIFGPVWTVLYIMMGVALYLFWQKKARKNEKQPGYVFFAVQLVFNALWSIIFFGWHLPLMAFMVIVVLWLAILLTIVNFLKLSHVAGYLLLPYLLWVSFASLLNFSVMILNW